MSSNVEQRALVSRVPRPAPPDGPYLVAGFGVAGLGAADAISNRLGPTAVAVWGSELPPPFAADFDALRERGVALHVGGDGVDLLAGRGCVVKSPGIPDEAPLFAAARAQGIEAIDEADLGWRLDDRPLVGITGTNGKSTVCALVAAAFEAAGLSPAVAGNTEGGPSLSAAAGLPGDVIVGELSSFQLRHSPALLPDVAVLTNCTHDSWHRHGGREGYERDKARVALRGDVAAPHAVLPADDPLGRRLARDVAAAGGGVTTFGFAAADYRIAGCDWDLDASTVELDVAGRTLVVRPRLPGPHNALNVVAALAAAIASGVELDVAVEAISAAEPVPGRFERVGDDGADVDVLVDYAHNPDGLERALGAVRHVLERRARGRLIVVASALPVFDDGQYAAMGAVLGASADRVVATTERLRADAPIEEPPAFFAALRASGVELAVEIDRRAAIDAAVEAAQAGDVVVVAGRGRRHTPIHVPGEAVLRVDDRDEARAALARRGG